MKKTLFIITALLLIITYSAAGIQPISPSESGNESVGTISFPLMVDSDTINVSLVYKGGEVTVFGYIPKGVDGLIAIMRSSETPHMNLSRKERVLFFWLATKKFSVEHMPGMYQLVSTAPLGEIHCPPDGSSSLDYQIGYQALRNDWQVNYTSGKESPDDMDVLFNGIIQMKEEQGLYRISEGELKLREDGLFSQQFPITDAAPVGGYTIDVLALKDKKIIGAGTTSVFVRKAGLVQTLSYMAATQGAVYGIIAVIIAFSAGIVVSFIFKRRGGGH
ncbi:MAG: TIGR02186 family protein [candidate division Zixibacteria bacterium]|nr:TIGR02186 family protein [Candidatus Tariuqbacter arcticus]